jgi:HD-GYP domain-containing protein (c-di-GMP phosphodiesterase class II)
LTQARTEIKAWSGRQFDPDVVEVFEKMPDDLFETLRLEINGQSYQPTLQPPPANVKGAGVS